MGQEFGRVLEAGLLPGEAGLAELQRVPVEDDRGQQVKAGDPVVLAFPGSVAQFAALVEVDGAPRPCSIRSGHAGACRGPGHSLSLDVCKI